MKKFLLSITILASALYGYAQNFEVISNQQVKIGNNAAVFHPKFMPGGESLLVSSENFVGLGIVDIKNQTYTKLTDMAGAGYMPAISADGKTIIARDADYMNQRISLYQIDVKTKDKVAIQKNINHINRIAIDGSNISFAVDGRSFKKTVINGKAVQSNANTSVYVTEEDLKLVVYNNGVRTVVDPLSTATRDVSYCWSSMSPDKTKLLFVAGNDAYVSDLNGKNLIHLGTIHAPVWRGNDYVVGMCDEDDGHQFTASDIVIIKAQKGAMPQQLTPVSGEIKMYPSVSEDGNKIAYHTTDGKLYVMTIKEK